jgi:hypothetical protein
MFKRVFSRAQPENVTKSIRVTKDMAAAIEMLADEVGETLNSYIVLVLDQYLQSQIEEGKLKMPLTSKANDKSAS